MAHATCHDLFILPGKYLHHNNLNPKEQALISMIGHFAEVPFTRSSFTFTDPIIPNSASQLSPINHHYPHLLLSLQPPVSSVWPGGLHTAPGLSPMQDHMVRMSTWAGLAVWRIYGPFCQLLHPRSPSPVTLASQCLSPPYYICCEYSGNSCATHLIFSKHH
jgi:hypothetical protein